MTYREFAAPQILGGLLAQQPEAAFDQHFVETLTLRAIRMADALQVLCQTRPPTCEGAYNDVDLVFHASTL